MPKRGYTAFHKPIMAVYESLPQGWRALLLWVWLYASKSSTGRSIRRSWWRRSMSRWTLQLRLLELPKPNNLKKISLKNLARPKTCGNKMKTPLLTSFFDCPFSDLSQIVDFSCPQLYLITSTCRQGQRHLRARAFGFDNLGNQAPFPRKVSCIGMTVSCLN